MIPYPNFTSKSELHSWLREKKDDIYHMKKSAIKHGDALHLGIVTQSKELEGSRIAGVIGKAATDGVTYPDGTLQIRSIINTTNIIDSYMDLHVPGLWKKNLAESKKRYLLNQHKQTFEGVISREVTATAKKFSWSAIGFDYEGSTEGLVFDSIVRPDDNAYMYDQYSKGHVLEHSVGMQYVKLFLCVDSQDKWWAEEKTNFDKYIEMAVNPDMANEYGMFWAVTEAKAIEGSAVLFGSNGATPTISITQVSGKSAADGTDNENKNEPPTEGTRDVQALDKSVSLSEIAKTINKLKTKNN